MVRTRSAHRTIASLAVTTLAAACAEGPGTAIELRIGSDLRTPGEIDEIGVKVAAGGRVQVDDSGIRLGPTLLQFPVTVGLTADGDPGDLTIDIEARAGGRNLVGRMLTLRFLPGKFRLVNVSLERQCILSNCPAGKTCVPGKGCISPEIGDDGGTADERVGPACLCESLFPMCVGAKWRYNVRQGTMRVKKDWAIGDYARIGERTPRFKEVDLEFGKDQLNAFLIVRSTPNDNSRRWVAQNRSQVLWERSDWYSGSWDLVRTRWEKPYRRRLDDQQRTVGVWSQDLSEQEYTYTSVTIDENGRRSERRLRDSWSVVGPSAVSPWVVARWPNAVCQRRVETELDVDPPSVKRAEYCFVPGIGKVYEMTQPEDTEEFLEEWDTKNCRPGKVTP